MSDEGFFVFVLVAFGVVIMSISGAIGHGIGREEAREKFLTFCTEQNIPYAKCKEEWERR